MEFGARALGSSSIIGDKRLLKMQSFMILQVKFRRSFRQFAPIVLRYEASKYYDIVPEHDFPYMLGSSRSRVVNSPRFRLGN